jgi:hypothetical protein
VSSGTSVERFSAALAAAGAEVVGVFVLVDMREVAETVTGVAAALPTESVSTYLQVLDGATASGILDAGVRELTVDAIVNRWAEDDPRWDLLPVAACASASPDVAHSPQEHLRRADDGRRGCDDGEAVEYLLRLVAGAQEVREAQPRRLTLQRRV